MNQCVPSWDLEHINPNENVFKLDYEVAELTWENGQLAMHELGHRRVPSKSVSTASGVPKYTWDKPDAGETLEAIVDQAKLQPYTKYQLPVNDEDVVPWLQHKIPTAATGCVNTSAMMTSDALVPSSNNRTDERSGHGQAYRSIRSGHDGGCSTRVGSCSGEQSAFLGRRVGRGGGSTTIAAAHEWSSCRDRSVSTGSGTFDTYDCDLGGSRLTTTSAGSPENTSSGKDYSKSTLSPDDSLCDCRPQPETNGVREKRKGKAKPSISNKRRRTAAIHNQSERKRRDKINQRMNTLQKLVPNSSKTDKASMLDEVIEYVKQLQAQLDMMSKMNMSSIMMPLAMQQQQQQQRMQMAMMGMGGMMDMNTICSNFPAFGFHPASTLMMPHMPPWNPHAANHHQVTNTTAMAAADPMSAFLACRSQPISMDAYGRMAALYQQMQNQTCGPMPRN